MRVKDRTSKKDGNKKKNLGGLLSMPEKTVQGWLNELVESQYRTECMQVLRRLPVMSVDYSVHPIASSVPRDLYGDSLDESMQDLSLQSGKQEKGNYELRVSLKCEQGNPSCRVYAPRMNKPKNLSWWVLLCSEKNSSGGGETLLAMKRVELKGAVLSVSLPFVVPAGGFPQGKTLILKVCADSIFDIDVTTPVSLSEV